MAKDPKAFHAAAKASAYVTQMCLAVIFGAWAGSKLDEFLGTTPWLLLIGLFLGTGFGIYSLVLGFQENPPPDAPT